MYIYIIQFDLNAPFFKKGSVRLEELFTLTWNSFCQFFKDINFNLTQ